MGREMFGDGGVGGKMEFVGGEVLQAPLSSMKETRKILGAVYVVDDDVVVVAAFVRAVASRERGRGWRG